MEKMVKPEPSAFNLKVNILLVDDQPADLLALGAILDELGHNLVEAHSGEEALRRLQEEEYAVILLDLQMYGLDGFETAKQVRGTARSRHIPIIFLTAYSDDRFPVVEAYSLGAVDYLVKPLVPVILRAKVAGFVELFQKTEQVKRQAEQLRQLERRGFEQRLAEENARLRDSEQRFARFMQHLPGLAWIKDLEGHYVYANDAAEKAFLTPRSELYGKTDREIFSFETGREFQENDRRALTSSTGIQVMESLPQHDGTLQHFVVNKFPILSPDGNVGLVGGMAIDITDRLRAEEAQQLLATIVESSQDAILSKTLDGRILTWNAGAERLFGYTADEAIGQPVSVVVPPELQEEERAILERLRTGERIEHYETVRVSKAGQRIDVSLTVSPIRDRSGHVVGISNVSRDITARKQAEEALRQSEAQFRQLADALPQIVWTARPDGFIDYYNERWYEYTGFPRDAAGEESWKPILHPDDVQRSVDTYYGCIRSGTLYQIEYRFKDRKNGTYRWFLGRAYPVRDEYGSIVRWFGTCTDIDDTKRAEEALKDADRRKDEFLAMLAHELRNPLAPVRNALQILKTPGASAEAVQRSRDIMERQIEHLARLVDDLLDVSRILRDRIELRKEQVDLGTVFARAIEMAQSVVDSHGHELQVSLPATPVLVHGDPVRLAQVIGNLLVNAAKYTDKAGFIWLTAERDGDEAIIRVRDTGIGIEPEVLSRVFDLFAQADRSLARSKGGLGIGLTLVKRLIEMHGGKVSAFSSGPNRGSEFCIRLPALAEAPVDVSPTAAREDISPAGSPRRVLVVDDNRDAADSTAALLRLLGHTVETVYDGNSVVDVVRSFRPDVVFLDIGLPGMSGFDVATLLREQPDNASLVLVAVTGYGQDEHRRRAREAGFNYHLVKPVDPADLHKLLCQAQEFIMPDKTAKSL